jgi:putative spermidine/putrescine transport system permease protein
MGKTIRTVALASLIFVSLPSLIVLVSSFSSAHLLQFPPQGPTLRPYADLISDATIRQSLLRSLLIGVESVFLAVAVAVPAALALFHHRVRLRGLITAYTMLGFSTPLVVSGMAFLAVYSRVGLIGNLWLMGIAITVVNLPFLLFSIASAVSNLDSELEEAAATLGAEELQTFLFVTLPGIMPGVVLGALMTFVFAITEFLVSLILATTADQTLPIVMFGSLRSGVTPTLAAVGGLYIAIAIAIVLLITRVRSLEQFLYQRD